MIGYYIHHQGSGHRMRAEAIAKHLSVSVVALSTADINGRAFDDVITLARDDLDPDPVDAIAGGALHWAPRHDRGLRRRMTQIAQFIERHNPAAVVVDVSVEVAVFVRLFGVPVIVIAMPGERTDPPHQLAYHLADAIIAPWPADLWQPEWLTEHLHKTTFTGGISRYDGRTPHQDPDQRSDVLIVTGTGGDCAEDHQLTEFVDDHPELSIRGLGPVFRTWVEDPWPALCSAGLVVTNAGQGSVADVAAAGRPAVLLPRDRPFAEQHSTAATVARAGLAHVFSQWPRPDQWRTILATVPQSAPSWTRWRTTGAGRRAAAAIEAVL